MLMLVLFIATILFQLVTKKPKCMFTWLYYWHVPLQKVMEYFKKQKKYPSKKGYCSDVCGFCNQFNSWFEFELQEIQPGVWSRNFFLHVMFLHSWKIQQSLVFKDKIAYGQKLFKSSWMSVNFIHKYFHLQFVFKCTLKGYNEHQNEY